MRSFELQAAVKMAVAAFALCYLLSMIAGGSPFLALRRGMVAFFVLLPMGFIWGKSISSAIRASSKASNEEGAG